MATNTDFTRTILVDIELRAEQIRRDAPAIIGEIDRLKEAQKELTAENKRATPAYDENAKKLRELSKELRDNNRYRDNVARAISAENGSLAQNRALVSATNRDYLEFGRTLGETAEQTISARNSLTQLTAATLAQEQAIGVHQRNVGNYASGFNSLNNSINQISRELPSLSNGFQQFSLAISNNLPIFADALTSTTAQIRAANAAIDANLLALREQAVAAALATGMTEAQAVAEGELAVTTAAATVEMQKQSIAKALLSSLFSWQTALSIGITLMVVYSKEISNFVKELIKGKPAIDLAKLALQDLNKALASTEYTKAIEQVGRLREDINLAKKGFIDKTQVVQEYNDTLGKTTGEVKNLDEAEKAIAKNAETYIAYTYLKAVANAALQESVKKTTEAQTTQLKPDDDVLNFWDKFRNAIFQSVTPGGDYLKGFAKERRKTLVTDAENDSAAQFNIFKKYQDTAAALFKQAGFTNWIKPKGAGQGDDFLTKQKKAIAEAEAIFKSSQSKQLQDIYDAYGAQLVAADQHYNDELKQLDRLNNLVDRKTKRKILPDAEYTKVREQLYREHNEKILKLQEDFEKKDGDNVRRLNNEIISLQNDLIKNRVDKEIAELKEGTSLKVLALDQENIELAKEMEKAQTAISNYRKKGNTEEADILQSHYDALNKQLQGNNIKRELAIKKSVIDENEIRRRADAELLELTDSNKVKAASFKYGEDSKQALDAYKMQLNNQMADELSVAGLTEEKKFQIKEKYRLLNEEAEKSYRLKILDRNIQLEQAVQQGVFDIIQQGAQQASQAKLNQLSNAKTAELENTSLTNTQKKLIEAKYAKLEKAEKEKAFKADQKLQIANITINGAVGITKTIASLGLPFALPFIGIIAAQTGFAIAKVLSAKPGFARGGQFVSDGRGAVLPGYSRTDNTNAYLRSGEAVVVSEAMRVPWARNAVSKINQMFGGRSFDVAASGSKPGFFAGGIYTDGGNANRYYQQPVVNSENLANTIAYQLINNMPPIYVDVKDVNSQQGILAQTVNRVNL